MTTIMLKLDREEIAREIAERMSEDVRYDERITSLVIDRVTEAVVVRVTDAVLSRVDVPALIQREISKLSTDAVQNYVRNALVQMFMERDT